jgi:hypothetical protein
MAQKYSEPGPWDDEPDELWWTDEKSGYDCHVCRNHRGALCGYVRIPEGHPLHGVSYSTSLPESLRPLENTVKEGEIGKRGIMDVFCLALGGDFGAGMLFNVHGGITFSDEFKEGGYWYGFDCSHCDDLSPKYMEYGSGGEYRDIEYVKSECASLAKQLRQVAG